MAGRRRVVHAGGMSRLARRLVAPVLALALLGGGGAPGAATPGIGVPPVAAGSSAGAHSVAAGSSAASSAASYAGVLRFPGLGASGREMMSGTIHEWGCRGGTIASGIYRWGCAGANNRYLLGHAFASFRPLHDFVAARGVRAGTRALVGMPVFVRGAGGALERYRVTWARVAPVDAWGRTGDTWAWNATDEPSLTFQTCFGARSEYRIIVRAVLEADTPASDRDAPVDPLPHRPGLALARMR
jgi:hypothetical protein